MKKVQLFVLLGILALAGPTFVLPPAHAEEAQTQGSKHKHKHHHRHHHKENTMGTTTTTS